MKLRLASLSLLALCLTLAGVPAMAQVVYDNGPTNGNTDAWAISPSGFIVSDTVNVANNGTTITGGSFAMWLTPGDTLYSAELSITSGENGGTSYFDQTVNFTQSGCVLNNYDYDICTETTAFNGPHLNSGTYWLNLQNARDGGYPTYWDENSGPSSASENSVGTIPSESFTVLGSESSTTTSTTTTGTVPEPSSLVLFASGFFGLTAVLRRKLL